MNPLLQATKEQMGISEDIQLIMREKKLSRSELAKLLGVNRVAVWEWESRNVVPREYHVTRRLILMADEIRRKSQAGRALIIILVALCVACLMTLVGAGPVMAADYEHILSAKVFRHLLETGDMLVVVHLDIHRDVIPAVPLNQFFLFRLMDATGTITLSSTIPYIYYNSGYDESAISFYFSADSAPAWGGAYVVRVSGNPEHHSSPVPEVLYTLTASDYSQFDTQVENREALGDHIIDIAHSLQLNWGVIMTENSDTGEVLTDTASSYFLGAIPNLRYMVPDIFPIISLLPDLGTPAHPSTTQADAYRQRYAGTIVGDALDELGSFFGGIPWNIITGIGTVILVLLLLIPIPPLLLLL